MGKLHMKTSQGGVSYLVQEGALEAIGSLLKAELSGGRAFVVSDEVVGPLYAEKLASDLAAPLLLLPAGEEHKQWDAVARIVRFLLGHGAERSDVVVAVGGGVVTDVAGFAAAIYLRGVRWVAVPTTLVGMVDAAIGGKTGVDLPEGKNLIGCFWQPRAVICDPFVLKTLPLRQLKAGLAEVFKAALIAPATVEHPLEESAERLLAGDFSRVSALILAAAKVKAEIVQMDERDEGLRASLNLGHTLGHALEAATGYSHFLHGEAVAWGLLAVLWLAREQALLASAEASRWAGRLEKLCPLPELSVSWEQVATFIGKDKKKRGGGVRWVLPRLGGVVVGVEVSWEEARQAFQALLGVSGQGPFTSLFL